MEQFGLQNSPLAKSVLQGKKELRSSKDFHIPTCELIPVEGAKAKRKKTLTIRIFALVYMKNIDNTRGKSPPGDYM